MCIQWNETAVEQNEEALYEQRWNDLQHVHLSEKGNAEKYVQHALFLKMKKEYTYLYVATHMHEIFPLRCTSRCKCRPSIEWGRSFDALGKGESTLYAFLYLPKFELCECIPSLTPFRCSQSQLQHWGCSPSPTTPSRSLLVSKSSTICWHYLPGTMDQIPQVKGSATTSHFRHQPWAPSCYLCCWPTLYRGSGNLLFRYFKFARVAPRTQGNTCADQFINY